MKFISRRTSSFASAIAFAAALWIATPVHAAETDVSGKQAAGITAVRTASAPSKRHHIWPRYRLTSWYAPHWRYADVAPIGSQSYFGWRPALLMVGVGY